MPFLLLVTLVEKKREQNKAHGNGATFLSLYKIGITSLLHYTYQVSVIDI